MRDSLVERLSSAALGTWLIRANVLVTLLLLWFIRHQHGSDYYTYRSLAEGIGHGTYSLWWWLPVDVPDTMRTPGYPMFVWLLTSWTTSEWPLKVVQAIAYGFAMRCVYRSIAPMGGGQLAKNLFLLILLPSVMVIGRK